LQLARRATENDDRRPSRTITHQIVITHFDGRPPTAYTVDFVPTVKGMFLVSCRELPEVMFQSKDEADGLIWAELAIEEATAPRRCSPDFPY
jgi:hypothetical protein